MRAWRNKGRGTSFCVAGAIDCDTSQDHTNEKCVKKKFKTSSKNDKNEEIKNHGARNFILCGRRNRLWHFTTQEKLFIKDHFSEVMVKPRPPRGGDAKNNCLVIWFNMERSCKHAAVAVSRPVGERAEKDHSRTMGRNSLPKSSWKNNVFFARHCFARMISTNDSTWT